MVTFLSYVARAVNLKRLFFGMADFIDNSSDTAGPGPEDFMALALAEAAAAEDEGEVPVGAVLVSGDGAVLARAHNRVITLNDPSAHAEILTLRAACTALGNYRLPGTTLYATVEPCPMCMGALIHARVAAVVYGAPDPKWGAAGSLYDLSCDDRLNHRIAVTAGVLENRCRERIQNFFRRRRKPVASRADMT